MVILSFSFYWDSWMESLTVISILPWMFSPWKVSGFRIDSEVTAWPTPKSVSDCDASTINLSPVLIRNSLGTAHCLNLASRPGYSSFTASDFHVCSLKFLTLCPRFLILMGSWVDLICDWSHSFPEKRLAFVSWINCSVDVNSSPLWLNLQG